MAIDQQGIMALPEGQQAMMPQLSYEDAYDAARSGLQQARPDADLELQETLDNLRALLAEATDEQLEQLISAVQMLADDPTNYARNVAQAVQAGDLEEGALPEEYDEEFLGAILTVLLEEKRMRAMRGGATMPEPQNFARGGIAEAARLVASKGRNGDTMLAHITPSEARLLRSRGGSGTINPETGLPEYFLKAIGRFFSGVAKTVKSILKSPIGRIIGTIGLATVLGPGGFVGAFSAPVAAGIASGAVTALSGGDLKSVLTSAVLGYAGSPGSVVSDFVGKYTGQFLTNATVKAAADAAIIGTGGALLTGQSFKDAVKTGLTTGAIAGGMSFAQNRDLFTAKANAEKAAANAPALDAEDLRPVKPSAAAVADESVVIPVETKDLAVLPGGTRVVQTTYSDGKITTQTVSDIGAPQSPEIMVSPPRAAISAASAVPTTPGTPPVTPPLAPPGTTDYIESTKQNIIGRSMGVPTAPTPAQIANIQPPVDVSSFDAFQNLRAVTPATVGPSGTPSTISTGGYRYEGGPPRPMSASAANVSTAPRIGAPYQTTTPGQYTIPGVGESVSTMGRGIKELGTGEFSAGAKTFMQGAEDLFFPGPSKEQIAQYARDNKMTFSEAEKAISPPMLRTYGPGIAAITGIGALGGAFERQEPSESEFAKRMRAPIDMSINPRAYYIQDLPGVLYDERGAIIGRGERAAPLTLGDIRYPTYSYTNYMPRGYAEGGVVDSMRVVELVKQGLSEIEAKNRAQYEQDAKKYVVQDLPTAKYDENGNIIGTTARQGVVPPPVTLERVRAPRMSYTNYQGRTGAGFPEYIAPIVPTNPTPSVTGFKGREQGITAAPAPIPVEQAPIARPNVREQTTNLFRQYVGEDPTQLQMDYWGGIFELDNEITPDEIARFRAAVGNSGRTPALMNMGGIAALKQGGYPRRTGQISGPGTETSDSIPAMLSDGEFVMTARAVRGMGNGSRRDGARKMYALMHKLERNAARG